MRRLCYLKLKNNADEVCYLNTEYIRELVLTHNNNGFALAIYFNDSEFYNISIRRCPEHLTEQLLANITFEIATNTRYIVDVDFEIDLLMNENSCENETLTICNEEGCNEEGCDEEGCDEC